MNIRNDHSRGILNILLIPIAFGCSSQHTMTDSELSEHLNYETTERPARITFTNGRQVSGYLLAIRHDSLEWYDTFPAWSERLHTAPAEDVHTVVIQTRHAMRPFWMGLGGCAIGGGLGFSYATAKMYDGGRAMQLQFL